jgi:hypothetical protein
LTGLTYKGSNNFVIQIMASMNYFDSNGKILTEFLKREWQY